MYIKFISQNLKICLATLMLIKGFVKTTHMVQMISIYIPGKKQGNNYNFLFNINIKINYKFSFISTFIRQA